MLSYSELEDEVIKAGECTVCGACISACPLYYIQLVDNMPKRPKKKAACKNCGVCYGACYITQKRNKDGIGIGSFIRVLLARMSNEKERNDCQDGGTVTAILKHALSEGLIDGALLTAQDEWRPEPFVAKSSSDIVSSAKTKYGTSPLLAKLRHAIVEHGLSRIGMVGLPCHIQAVENLKLQKIEPLSSAIVLTVGLFCTGNLEYSRIKNEVSNLGLNMDEIQKLTVRDGYFNIHSTKGIERIPLNKTRCWSTGYCPCRDYSCELADISVGSGTMPGSSTVIVRTEKGDRIIQGIVKNGILTASPVKDTGFLLEASERKRAVRL